MKPLCRPHSARAALLLEVVVSLTILVAAMGYLGAQLVSGLNVTGYAEEELRASLLADRILTLVELDPEMQRVIFEEEETEEEFGDEYPGYFWRVRLDPAEPDDETSELWLVTIEVLFQRDPERIDSIDDADVVRELVLLKAEPQRIDLVEDAGLSESMVEQLQQLVPSSEFDPHAVDLHQLVALLNEETLAQLLPMIMPLLSQFGAGNVPADLAEAAQEFLGGDLEGGDGLPSGALDNLTPEQQEQLDALREMAGEAGAPPDVGRRPRGGRGGEPPEAGPRRGGPPGGRGGRGEAGGREGAGGRGGQGGRGAQAPRSPSRTPRLDPGQGSGPDGSYTLEDLMRMRDEHRRQGGGR